MTDKAIRAAKLTAAGILDKARARTAVTRAGGQIAPSKYLPDVPRQVHAGGGKVELRSKAAEAIRNQPQLKGSVDQLLAVASKGKGVKQAELVNAGRPTGNIISKEQLAQHFENAVPQVQVEKYGDIAPVGHTEDEKKEYNHLSAERLFGKADENQLRRLLELEDKIKTKSDATYGKWTLPVGKNYREHLLHLPPKGADVTHKVTGAFPRDFGTEAEAHAYIDQMNRAAEEPGMETIRDNLRQYPLTYSPEGGFHSSHWSVPNVIAHVRMKDLNRGDDLFVQEVQSDWGQNGREQGFYDPKNPYEVVRKGTKEVVSKHPDYSSMWDAYRTHPDSDNLNYGDVRGEKVPNGAYVGNTQQWTDLALKHVLTEAAKGGHKRVVFAPGEANADLYGQRTKITQATLKPMPDKPEMLGELYGWDKDTGEQIDHGPISDEKELASALGKKHAQALLAQPMVRNSHRSLIDPSMVLGGHGMVDYYSNIVHPSALKLLQQHDPSIQPEKPYALPGQEGTDSDYKGFSLPMTETARQSILKNGFGAFKRGGTVGKEEGGATGSLREKALWPSAQAIKAGTGSREAHEQLVNKIKPVSPYAEPVPPASDQQVHDALTKDKQPKAFAPRSLAEGTPVAVRLDIPAYEKRNTWVVSVHHPKTDFTAGEVIGYDSVAHIGNPRFGVHPTGALNIASGKPKATIATVHGNWKKTTPEDAFALSQTIHNDPQWRQVGMDPERHSYFYDRETQEPVMAADEALHIGPLVYAKNPVYGKKTDFAFSSGGDVSAAIALTRRFTKDGKAATMALKPKGK
jgi:hypothetical protein